MKIDLTESFASEKLKAYQALYLVMDPELGINIVDMGLIYSIDFSEDKEILLKMTLSTPSCPMGESIIIGVEKSLQRVFSDYKIQVELVWEPVWNYDLMSEEGKRQLSS